MEKNSNTINLEYQEVNKVSIPFKMLSFVLVLIFTLNPLSELVDIFSKRVPHTLCCQPFDCMFNGYIYHFL